MTSRTRSIVVTTGFVISAAVAAAGAGQAPAASQTQAVRQIPGITAKDVYPNGCVDCHVAGKGTDMRISTLIATWTSGVPAPLAAKGRAVAADASKIKGKHPATPNAKANIPQTCLAACHKRGSTIAPPFAQLMHAIHLVGGSQNRFLSANQGECTHCHKLDQKTAVWKVPSGAEK